MATDVANDEETGSEQPEDTEPKRKFQLSKKAKILLLLVLVMAVEAVGFLLLVPSTGAATDEDDAAELADIATVEVAIGNVQANNATTPGTLYSVTFKLAAVVARDQEAIFRIAVTKEHKGRVKQAVESIIGDASYKELTESDHSVISRQIKEKVNKVLGRSYVNQVIITEYRVFPL